MSCLFISLGKLLHQPHTTVRHTICNYMAANLDHTHQGMTLRDWIRWQQQAPSPAAYIRAMRSTAEWGGAMELAVATQCYRVDIDVVNGSGKRVADFVWRDACTARNKLVLQWTGNHYEPVRRLLLG